MGVYSLQQHPTYDAVFPIDRMHGSSNQRVEIGMALPTITPRAPLINVLLPVPMTLCSSGLEVLILKGGMFPPEDSTMANLN